jgi:hypothetical protein
LEAGKIIGPVSATDLARYVREGRIAPDYYVRKGAQGKWIIAKRVKGLLEGYSPQRIQSQTRPLNPSAQSTQTIPNNPTLPAKIEEDHSPRYHPATTSSIATDRGKTRSHTLIVLCTTAGVACIITIAAFFLWPRDNSHVSIVNGFRSKPYAEQHMDIHDKLASLALHTTKWSLCVRFQDKERPLLSPSHVAEQVLSTKPENDAPDDAQFIAEHRTALAAFFNSLSLVSNEKVSFLFDTEPPLHVSTRDGRLCLIIDNFASTTIYNTLRLTNKQRAAKVLDTFVLPILHKLDKSLYESDIPCYCIVYFYGSKDFTYESATAITPEVLMLIVNRDDCHEFARGTLSQEKLLSRSELFIGSSDEKPRRVDIVID